MARIALITRTLTEESLTLAKALLSQQNEILFITSALQEIPPSLPFQVLTPFKKWTALEALRLFPRLLSSGVEVFHFLFSQNKDVPTWAHWTLGRMIQPFPRKIVAASFFVSPELITKSVAVQFIQSCHLITWGSRFHLLEARKKFQISEQILSEVMPPILEVKYETDKKSEYNLIPNSSEDIQKFVQNLGSYFVIPGTPDDFFQIAKKEELYFEKPIRYLFLGERLKLYRHTLDYFFLGQVKKEDLFFVLKNSLGLLLAFSDLSLLELQQYAQWSRYQLCPLLVRPSQSAMLPGLVLHERTGWVLEHAEKSLRELMLNNPDLKKPESQDDRPIFELIDSTTNEMNRLYQKALLLRS